MAGNLIPLDLAPGINKVSTETTAEGGYYDCEMVRFRDGYPESIGGWQKYSESTLRGVARFLADWTSIVGTDYLTIGTHLKFYFSVGTNYYDITPVRNTETLGATPFDTVNTSTTVTVNDTAHGCVDNDFVTIAGVSAAVNGIPAAELNAEHQVTVVDVDSYTIEVTTAATSTGSGGTGTITAEYQINVGLNYFVGSTGYGVGAYGSGAWGSTTSISVTNQLRLWGGDNFGDDFVFNVRGGAIYYFADPGGTLPPNRAVEISTVSGASDTPTIALQVMMSDVDRHVIAFGCNPIGSSDIDSLLIRWSDQEAAIVWTPKSTNSAGGVRLSSGSFIIGAIRTRQEILVWTDDQLYSMNFIGGDLVYSFELVEEGVSMLSPRAAASASGKAFFMDRGSFRVYEGGAVSALDCPIQNYVFEDINYGQSYKIHVGVNNDFHEVWFFYPSAASDEIDRFVIYNYKGGVWSHGSMPRGAWLNAGARIYPLATETSDSDDNTHVFYQDAGWGDENSDAITCYVETGAMDIEGGNSFLHLSRFLPDMKFLGMSANGAMTVTFKGRNSPSEDWVTMDTVEVLPTTDMTYPRGRARQMAIRFSAECDVFGFRLGNGRIDIKSNGRK